MRELTGWILVTLAAFGILFIIGTIISYMIMYREDRYEIPQYEPECKCDDGHCEYDE